MQTIRLDSWYSRSVYCPFCGEEAPGRDVITGCCHYLYSIVNGALTDYGNRLPGVLGLGPEDDPFDCGLDIPAVVEASAPNALEFSIDNPDGDVLRIGFAAREEDLSVAELKDLL